MSFDSLNLRIATHELHQNLIDGTIRHIEQSNPTTFSLKIALKHETHWLTISAHSNHARLHLIQKPPKGQKQSYFADFLATHLKHGKIVNIQQLGWDRILKITIQPISDEPIQLPQKAIIAEFMGKHSNIILIDTTDNRIIECLKHIDETMSRYREILPGETYTLPPQQDKLDPMSLDKATFSGLFADTELNWKSLFNRIDGLSPTLAKEIIARTQQCELWDAYNQVIAYFDPKNAEPQLLMHDNDPIAASPLPLRQHTETTSQNFDTMNEALAAYYDAVTLKENLTAKRQTLKQALEKQKNLLKRKEKGLHKDLDRSEKADEYRIQGELILANLHKISRGQEKVKLQNYYSEEMENIAITLNPIQTPSENAQAYFKKYTKAKRGLSQIKQRLGELEIEIQLVKNYELKLGKADTLDTLNKLYDLFSENGYIKTQNRNKKQQNTTEGPFRKYVSKNGFHIYVGRNSHSNDMLLREIAKPRDMWLHAKQIHGSHVIIRNPENRPDIPMPTLLQAAQLAAFYSKAHHSSYVPVDYTWARYVVKRKGNVAGYVHYTHEKTLYVEPAVPQKNSK